jgi:hypothetical protein
LFSCPDLSAFVSFYVHFKVIGSLMAQPHRYSEARSGLTVINIEGEVSWSKLYGRQITEEEYREICDNLSSFFQMLHKWDKKDKEVEK